MAAVAVLGLVGSLAVVVSRPTTAAAPAKVKAVEHGVDLRTPGTPQFSPVTSDSGVKPGSTVRTDDTGLAEIAFADGSLTRVGPDSLYEVETLRVQENRREIVGRLDTGQTFHRVAEVTGSESRFEVEAGGAVASVRGTEFSVICISAQVCEIEVTDGMVVVRDAQGQEIEVRAGSRVIVTDGVIGDLLPGTCNDWVEQNAGADGCPTTTETTIPGSEGAGGADEGDSSTTTQAPPEGATFTQDDDEAPPPLIDFSRGIVRSSGTTTSLPQPDGGSTDPAEPPDDPPADRPSTGTTVDDPDPDPDPTIVPPVSRGPREAPTTVPEPTTSSTTASSTTTSSTTSTLPPSGGGSPPTTEPPPCEEGEFRTDEGECLEPCPPEEGPVVEFAVVIEEPVRECQEECTGDEQPDGQGGCELHCKQPSEPLGDVCQEPCTGDEEPDGEGGCELNCNAEQTEEGDLCQDVCLDGEQPDGAGGCESQCAEGSFWDAENSRCQIFCSFPMIPDGSGGCVMGGDICVKCVEVGFAENDLEPVRLTAPDRNTPSDPPRAPKTEAPRREVTQTTPVRETPGDRDDPPAVPPAQRGAPSRRTPEDHPPAPAAPRRVPSDAVPPPPQPVSPPRRVPVDSPGAPPPRPPGSAPPDALRRTLQPPDDPKPPTPEATRSD